MDKDELASDREIDPSQLDVECIRQADTFYKWAERYIKADATADEMKSELSALEARLQIDARNNPDAFGILNVTEAAIKAAVLSSNKYVQATKQYQAAIRKASLLGEAVKAMNMKKTMLDLLVTLHGQEYFAGPSVPRDIIAAWEQHNGRKYKGKRGEKSNARLVGKARDRKQESKSQEE